MIDEKSNGAAVGSTALLGCPVCKRKMTMNEDEREWGMCSSCYVKTWTPEKRKAFSNALRCAFNGSSEKEKGNAIQEAINEMKPNAGLDWQEEAR